MSRRLSFTRIAETEDTGDPVIRARFADTGSFMDAILVDDCSEVRVWLVESQAPGDMRRMLDAVCKQLETRRVVFLEPNSLLLSKLEGVTEVEEVVEGPDGEMTRSHRAEVTWEYNRENTDGD